eukprot:6198301-Pleurochrysis_carterae.AAC.5
MSSVNASCIWRAANRLRGHVNRTPLLRCEEIEALAQKEADAAARMLDLPRVPPTMEALFKCEHLQVQTGTMR